VVQRVLIFIPTWTARFIQGERQRLKKPVMVLDADRDQCRELCSLLEKSDFKATPQYSTIKLEKRIKQSGCQAIFWDIDTVNADNRMIRDLTLKFPGVYFFCLSKHPFHPELKDAICYHIYACLNRPIDPNELFYWLKSIDEDEVNSDTSANL
jgi:DNA-binding NtrC family response regulator